MRWLCWHVGTHADPKLRLVAKDADARLGDVIAAWAISLERASASNPRGSIGSLDGDELGICLDVSTTDAARIIAAMKNRGLLTDTGDVVKWSERQHGNDAVRKAHRKDRSTSAAPEISGAFRNSPPTGEDKTEQKTKQEDSSLRSELAPMSTGLIERSRHPAGLIDETVWLWNEMADRVHLPRVQRLTPARRRQIPLRIAELGGIDGWKAALAKVENSAFLTGRSIGDRSWRVDFDFLLSPEKLVKLMEGRYDDVKTSGRNGFLRLAEPGALDEIVRRGSGPDEAA